MTKTPEELRIKAKHCRTIVAAYTGQEQFRVLEEVAEFYEQSALRLEEQSPTHQGLWRAIARECGRE